MTRRRTSLHWHPLLIAVLTVAAAARADELSQRVESLITTSKFAGAKVGVSILDLSTGRTLADVHADTALIPASNMKLLTSGTALMVLGEEFVFKTELLVDGETLTIKGGGDPALADPTILDRMSPKMSVDGMVEALAGAVKQAGVTHVTRIIADDRIFDRQYIHPTWPKDQLSHWYCAEVSGLNFHTNVISAFPSPSPDGVGQPPAIALEPSAVWLEIENRARTVADGENSVWLARDPGDNHLSLLGKVRFPTKVPVEITLHDVATIAGQLIAAELPRAGVGVGTVGPLGAGHKHLSRDETQAILAAVHLAEPGETCAGRSVAVVTTHIRDVMERCNNDSQNLYAESLIKRIGHEVTGEPGSWTNGSSVIRMTISDKLGPDYAATTVVADGSGMSRDDRVAPRTFTHWLDKLQKNPKFGEQFVESLATPGEGTLHRRFGDIKLHADLRAKSGSINGVRCLSGFLTDKQAGRRVAFSIMVNELKEGDQVQALQFHEDVVALIDHWLASQRAAASTTAHTPSKPS